MDCARPNCSWNSQHAEARRIARAGDPALLRIDEPAAPAALRHHVQHAQADGIGQAPWRSRASRSRASGVVLVQRGSGGRLLSVSCRHVVYHSTRNLDLVLTASPPSRTLIPTKVDSILTKEPPVGEQTSDLKGKIRDHYARRAVAAKDATKPLSCCGSATSGCGCGQSVEAQDEFARGLYDVGETGDLPDGGRAREPRLRQPDRARRPAARRDGARPRLAAAASTCCSPPNASAPPARPTAST